MCKACYLDTLGISQKKVYTTHANKSEFDTPKADGRGKSTKKGFSDDVKNVVRNHIKSFPCVESHYCRRDSKKQYLESHLNINKMYELYTLC